LEQVGSAKSHKPKLNAGLMRPVVATSDSTPAWDAQRAVMVAKSATNPVSQRSGGAVMHRPKPHSPLCLPSKHNEGDDAEAVGLPPSPTPALNDIRVIPCTFTNSIKGTVFPCFITFTSRGRNVVVKSLSLHLR